MLRWTDLAEWRGPTPNVGGKMIEQRGMVVHIAEGSYEGTIAYQKNRGASVSSHFVVANSTDAVDGKIAQVVDLDVTAWTQIDGNGHWVSVENSGFSPNKLSPAQFESNAQLYARGMREFGWPSHLATSPADVGLAYHGLACAGPGGDPRAPWTVQNTSGQTWGHCDCPGAGVISQLPAMLMRAIDINLGVDVALTIDDAQLVASTLLGTLLGKSGPTVGVALQSTYQQVTNPAALASAIVAALPADKDISQADVEAAVRAVFADAATP